MTLAAGLIYAGVPLGVLAAHLAGNGPWALWIASGFAAAWASFVSSALKYAASDNSEDR